ncbi:MAG: DUF6752 domain-containing protein [Streptosporangiaceae bacterium]
MRQRIRDGGRRLAERAAPTMMASLSDVVRLRRDLEQAKRRIAALEAEVQELRRLSRRVAEVTDVVEEVLLPATNRDEERVRQALEKYADTF